MRVLFPILLLVVLLPVGCKEPVESPKGVDETPSAYEDSSAYITAVFDYAYAPGQHASDRRSEDANLFIGQPDRDVYLGGFGGYIVAGFDHDVPNADGADIEVYSSGADAEPAVVYVMCDENANGLPDDTWYELAGSEADHEATIRGYELTYYRPEEGGNVRWRDNQGNSGELLEGYKKDPVTDTYLPTDSWWWAEADADSVTFSGTRLPDAYYNASTTDVPYWTTFSELFTWGYAENVKGTDYDATTRANRLDISNAVDASGQPVHLESIRFIKVQTAVFQQAGWLNEISSEVKGARDLHYQP